MLESFFKKAAGLEVRKSFKRRLQHRCFPVNIAKFLKTAFSIKQLWWLLLELRYNFQISENSMTLTYLMTLSRSVPATLVSIHMRFPMNTYKVREPLGEN